MPGSPEADSGSESLKVSLTSGGGGGVNMPEAAASQDSHLSSLTNSLKVKLGDDDCQPSFNVNLSIF